MTHPLEDARLAEDAYAEDLGAYAEDFGGGPARWRFVAEAEPLPAPYGSTDVSRVLDRDAALRLRDWLDAWLARAR